MFRFRPLFFTSTFLCLLLFISAFSQDMATLAKTKYHIEKATKLLDKSKALSPYYAVNANGVFIYASLQNKLKNDPEFQISWNQIEKFNAALKKWKPETALTVYKSGKYVDREVISPIKTSPTSMANQIFEADERRLKGLKIAIDPGHTAGDMETGGIEQKCLNFKCDSSKGLKSAIEISEGMLTFATATLLKNKLEAEGAEVFMTRNFSGGSAYGMSFESWIKKKTVDSLYAAEEITLAQKNSLLNPNISKKDKFRTIFKDLELKKRAQIINNYQPDFTVIIHYNVDETNTGWTKPANRNFNMTFVGGAFMKSDLSTPEKRFEFLRLLISDDLEKSIALSSEMVKSFEKNLHVKTAKFEDATYLIQGCLATDAAGVYCRNLQLTRYIHSPLVYGETLYQDNIQECIALSKESDKTKNQRVQQVAEAYFQGVLNYMKK
jgi:N-acetylmuramoyl-L-alanine amidase